MTPQSSALVVCYPHGTKAKDATGIVASEPGSKQDLEPMAAVQRKAPGEFIVTEVEN